MKSISDLKKKATVLDRNQMKSLFGGASCASGETKHYCHVSVDGGGSYGGYVCADSAQHAAKMVASALEDQGLEGGTVAC